MTTQPQPDRVRIGGLMRCCMETIGDLYQPDGSLRATEGQTLQCKHVPTSRTHRMIFRDGAWEWDRAAAGLPELPDTTDA